MMILAGAANMSPKTHPDSPRSYAERDGIMDRDGTDDRLPIQVAAPIIVALSLSLWGGIGFVISALL
jgi:hypothetical protein